MAGRFLLVIPRGEGDGEGDAAKVGWAAGVTRTGTIMSWLDASYRVSEMFSLSPVGTSREFVLPDPALLRRANHPEAPYLVL